MARRYTGPGGDPAQARRLIRRRGAWLIVFGIAHVVLLYSGDVLDRTGRRGPFEALLRHLTYRSRPARHPAA